MAVLGGIVGAIVGFTVGIVFTEIIFANSHDWPNVVPFALAVAGWLAGAAWVRRARARRAGAT